MISQDDTLNDRVYLDQVWDYVQNMWYQKYVKEDYIEGSDEKE